jgi:hypothetical protein
MYLRSNGKYRKLIFVSATGAKYCSASFPDIFGHPGMSDTHIWGLIILLSKRKPSLHDTSLMCRCYNVKQTHPTLIPEKLFM